MQFTPKTDDTSHVQNTAVSFTCAKLLDGPTLVSGGGRGLRSVLEGLKTLKAHALQRHCQLPEWTERQAFIRRRRSRVCSVQITSGHPSAMLFVHCVSYTASGGQCTLVLSLLAASNSKNGIGVDQATAYAAGGPLFRLMRIYSAAAAAASHARCCPPPPEIVLRSGHCPMRSLFRLQRILARNTDT